jgi:ATP-binding protein involved in chromosome partitioning
MMKKSTHIVKIKDVLDALKALPDPLSNKNIVESEIVTGVSIKEDHISLALKVPPDKVDVYEDIRKQAEVCIKEATGLHSVFVVLTAHKQDPDLKISEHPQFRGKFYLPHIKNIIAVASGKGGVGKSTTAVNLALAFKQEGLSVGLLDADIYGPSIPQMLNIKGPLQTNTDKKIIPHQAFGIQCMSMGFLVPENMPILWRGPMIQLGMKQLICDVAWEDLDILVIDLPPGTGDTQITLVQKVPLTGAIIVSTPQDIALLDAKKALMMFQKVEIPVLGVIENMSYFECPHCGHRCDIFSHGGAEKEAGVFDVKFLGRIPLHLDIRQASDQGSPYVEHYPKEKISKTYKTMAQLLLEKIKL